MRREETGDWMLSIHSAWPCCFGPEYSHTGCRFIRPPSCLPPGLAACHACPAVPLGGTGPPGVAPTSCTATAVTAERVPPSRAQSNEAEMRLRHGAFTSCAPKPTPAPKTTARSTVTQEEPATPLKTYERFLSLNPYNCTHPLWKPLCPHAQPPRVTAVLQKQAERTEIFSCQVLVGRVTWLWAPSALTLRTCCRSMLPRS